MLIASKILLPFRKQVPRSLICRLAGDQNQQFDPLSLYEEQNVKSPDTPPKPAEVPVINEEKDYRSELIKRQIHKIFKRKKLQDMPELLNYGIDQFKEEPTKRTYIPGSRTYGDFIKPLDYRGLALNYLATPKELRDTKIPQLHNGLEYVARRKGLMSRDAISTLAGMNVSDFYKEIPTPEEVDYDMLGGYTPPSKDSLLLSLAQKHYCNYILSTSTITSLLVHTDYLLTAFKSPLFHQLSHEYVDEPLRYIISTRKPNMVYATLVQENPRIVAIDSNSGFTENTSLIFLKMGKYLEAMMTQNQADFNRKFLLKNKQKRYSTDEPAPEFFSFLHAGSMMLRSQIDSAMLEDKKLKKIEIKTRAVTPQRYDADHYDQYLDYRINKDIGIFGSYEREYYDLIRGGFIKFVHQMTIGDMDGVIIAYHNTKEIFGFEYFNRWHLEKRIYGSQEFASICFRSSLLLLQKIFDHVLQCEDLNKAGQTFKLGFYAHSRMNALIVLVEKIDNIVEYKKRLDEDMPDSSLNDVVDHYEKAKIAPKVNKYIVSVYPKLNGIDLPSGIPVFFEQKDSLEYEYDIRKVGRVSVEDYMQFLHEAYKSEFKNIETEYSGTWSSK